MDDAGLVDAELHLAGLELADRLRDVAVDTVPVFGVGIRPRGPSTLPSRPPRASCPGSPDHVEVDRAAHDLLDHFVAADEIGAGLLRSFCFSPPAMASTLLVLPRPCGSTTVPRTIWSACVGSTPS